MACVAWFLGAGIRLAAAPSSREHAAPPSGLACASDGAHYLAVQWDATAGPAADLYDVQCAAENATSPSDTFLSFTCTTSPARIGPLQPQAVRCGVRSHDAAASSIVSGWSAVSTPVRCDVLAGDPDRSPQSTRTLASHSNSIDGEATRSVAMWRASEFEFMNEV